MDNVDLLILKSLQSNGRMTNVSLAEIAGISAPPCLRRLKALEKENIITGYFAEIDTSVVGYSFSAFCFVSLASHAAGDVKVFIDAVNGNEYIRQCYSGVGESDYLLKVVAKDFDHYDSSIRESILKIPGVSHLKTFVLVRKIKDEKGVPIKTDRSKRYPDDLLKKG